MENNNDKKKYCCDDCMEYKKGDCGGLVEPADCEDFRCRPHMTEVDRRCWPKFCSGTY